MPMQQPVFMAAVPSGSIPAGAVSVSQAGAVSVSQAGAAGTQVQVYT